MELTSAADSPWAGYSTAERDRRWAAVRKNLADADLDCLFVPLCVDPYQLRLSPDSERGVRSDGRYLTQMENAAVVLPADGRPPIVINERGVGNRWVPDARSANEGMRGSWASAMAAALIDLGMERARIGVSGLKRGTFTHVRTTDGVVNHSSYDEVLRRLPNATFADATDVLGFARYVKSDEEIACLTRAAAIAEAGIERLAELARPGRDVGPVYAQVTVRLLELGSERHPWALIVDGKRFDDTPRDTQFRAGSRIRNEMSTVWGNQLAQEDQPMILGSVPEKAKAAVELQRELWEESLGYLQPGRSFDQVLGDFAGFARRKGVEASVTMHGRGLGNEGPILTGRTASGGLADVPILANTTFVWKPAVRTPDGSSFQWAGDVVVTPTGAKWLGARAHGWYGLE